MTVKKALPWLVLAAVLGFVAWKLHTSQFDFRRFWENIQGADFRLIAVAVVIIYSNNVLRALRWAVFLRPTLKLTPRPGVHWWSLLGSQFVGFAGLAIFGRIGELIRPLLVARRTGLTFSSQVAVVTVERVFDLAAFGLIFSLNLLFSPQLKTLPYLGKAGYTIGGLTLFLLVFVGAVRVAGGAVAAVSGRLTGLVSKPAGEAVREKVLSFRDGLNVIDNLGDFVLAACLSVALWLAIAVAYVLVLRAFPGPVRALSAADVIVLMGFSIAGSALPIPGGSGAWAGNTFALAQLFHIPGELAGSAGLMVWLVGTMAVVPVGLVYAKLEGISLGRLTKGSEVAQETVPLPLGDPN